MDAEAKSLRITVATVALWVRRIAGLLAEGEQRRLVAKILQISRQNDFAMVDGICGICSICGIGGECAGAMTLLASGYLS